MDEQVKNIFRYALVLLLITAVVAGLLASVNLLTQETIAQNTVLAEQEALREVMPDATAFEAYDAAVVASFGVEAVYAATGSDGALKGYCVKVSQNGYGGAIQAVIGVGIDGKTTGVSVVSHAETPGLGANIEKESFRQQYVGQGETSVVKAGAQDGQINAVSGATISSKALTDCVNQAITVAVQLQGLQSSGIPAAGGNTNGGEVGTDE